MKTGFNLLLWTTHVTAEHTPILERLKKAGYDGVEIPIFEGMPDHYARLGEALDKLGLGRTVVSVIGPGKNPLSASASERRLVGCTLTSTRCRPSPEKACCSASSMPSVM